MHRIFCYEKGIKSIIGNLGDNPSNLIKLASLALFVASCDFLSHKFQLVDSAKMKL